MITGKTAKIVSKMGVGTFLESQSRFKSARVPKDVSKDVSRREGDNLHRGHQNFCVEVS